MRPLPALEATGADRVATEGLCHAFGSHRVLQDISFSVQPGELLCLVGPSGCGKSTLLRLLAGLEHVQAGRIVIDGEVVGDAQHHKLPEVRGVGLVFQDFALFPHMSLAENVAFGLAGRARAERRRIALEMLGRVGLAERADDMPHRLSGGQQQRVALARALAPRPRLVLLDEPFSNLDVRLRQRMRADTLALLEEMQTAAILVTHDPEEAMYMADRIALLNEGRIVQLGTPASLYRAPVTPYAAEFFGDVNRCAGIVRGGAVATPLGPVQAPGIEEGAAVEVLVRPEAIEMEEAGFPGTVPARVESVHLLGSASTATLAVQHAGQTLRLHAHFPSGLYCVDGCELRVRLAKDGVFVFRAGS